MRVGINELVVGKWSNCSSFQTSNTQYPTISLIFAYLFYPDALILGFRPQNQNFTWVVGAWRRNFDTDNWRSKESSFVCSRSRVETFSAFPISKVRLVRRWTRYFVMKLSFFAATTTVASFMIQRKRSSWYDAWGRKQISNTWAFNIPTKAEETRRTQSSSNRCGGHLARKENKFLPSRSYVCQCRQSSAFLPRFTFI